jgi:hypothetical protein
MKEVKKSESSYIERCLWKLQWNFTMKDIYGRFQWKVPMEGSNGRFQWKVPMEGSNGRFQWKVPMESSVFVKKKLKVKILLYRKMSMEVPYLTC